MQNYGGYFQQNQQGQNPMYPTPGGQNNMNQSNMRNMFGGPQNYGMPQMPQAPQQQYGYPPQQQQMPQNNFVFHFDYNNTPSNMNMNMNMGPYAPSNPPQYGASPYGGIQMPQNDTQKKEDKNDQLFDAFDPFNPKPRAKPKPKTQPQQNTNPQPPATPNPPQIQMLEDVAPKKQDLNAFRTAFASLAGPAQQPQQPQQQPQQQQFGMQPNQMFGGNMQAPPPPQIEGFNFVSGTQCSQPVQMDNFNFGSQQQPQNNTFISQTPTQPIQQPSPPQPQNANTSASKNAQEDIFASFNPISSPQPAAPSQQQPTNFSTNNQTPNQFGNSDAFSFNQPQTGSGSGFTFGQQQAGSNGGIQSFNQPQTGSGSGFTFGQQQAGSNGGIQSFNQPQTGSNGGIQSFDQPQTGSGSGFTPFGQQHNQHQHHHHPQQAGSTGGILSFNPQGDSFDPIQSFNQPQAGSSGISPQFSQPQAGSTGNLPISAIDDLFGSPASQNQTSPQNDQPPAKSDNPFLFNVSTDSNPFVKSNKSDTNSSPLAPSQNINQPQPSQQEAQNNGMFNPFGSTQNQPKPSTGSTSFGDSFRQAIGEPSSPSQPPPQLPTEAPKPLESQNTDFRNIFSEGHNFFEQQEQQFKTSEPQQQQQQPVAPEGFTFGSQPAGDSGAPNFSNFTFNSPQPPEQAQNSQFGGPSFANFGSNEQQSSPQIDQQVPPQPATAQPFTPFGVTDLQPMSNSTFVISGSGDSVSSQPTAVSADPVDTEKIPYFVEQEKKMEFENRIKNDTMSVFDPFNPNPQPIQQQNQQQNQQLNLQNEQQKSQEELKLSASVNASVDTIRNMFGGPSDEPEQNNEDVKQPEKEEPKVTSTENDQLNNANQNIFLSGFNPGFPSENNNDNQNKKPDIQLNVGLGDDENKENNGFDNSLAFGGDDAFQKNYGRSPEANSFGFGGFGFNNSFGKGNVFQHMFEQGNNEEPATFNDFFPHHNSEPMTAPIQINEIKEENKEKAPPKSETPFATGFDLMGFAPPNQNQNKEEKKQEEEQNPFIFGEQQKIDFNNPFGSQENNNNQNQTQKQEEQKPKENPQNQKEIDFDNPFINQTNLSLFGQAPDSNSNQNQNQNQTTQKNEPFDPFGNQSIETAPQTSSSLSFSSAEVLPSTQPELQKKEEPEATKKTEIKQSTTTTKTTPSNNNNKGGDIFDEIPDNINEIDKSLPEKPPPFIMPTLGDNSTNPFTSVLSSTSPSSNPFTSQTKENPFVTNNASPSSNPFTNEENKPEAKKQDDKEEPKKDTGFDDLLGFSFGNSTTTTTTNNSNNVDNPFIANFGNETETKTKQTEKVDDNKKEEEKKTEQNDTSGFTFSSATPNNTSNEANPFSNGFNPFGGNFNNPFATTTTTTTATNDNNNEDQNKNDGNSGFTFTPSFEKEEEKPKENQEENTTTTKETEQQQQQQQNETKSEETNKNEDNNNNNNNNTEKLDEQENNDKNMNIIDTLDDDLFDMNSIEDFKPIQHKDKNSDIFGDIHTFPVSNSTSDFLELKQKKENKNNVGQSVLMMSDGGVGSKSPISPLADRSHQNINTGFVSILTPYGNTTDDLRFSASSDGDDPEVLKIMSDDNQISQNLKKFVKPPENDFYGSFEKDPHPIRIFPKFEDTKAAKVLADFVSKQFNITASFASTSKKQKEEIDMNSIFNVPAASEANDDDDFLLII